MPTLLKPLALVSVCLALAACGGGDEEDSPGASITVDKTQPLTIKGFEYRFDPETVTVTGGGGQVELVFENAGSLAHNVRLFRDGAEVGGSPTFQGGETRTTKVDLEPGDYELICTVGDHADLGMKGTLTVK